MENKYFDFSKEPGKKLKKSEYQFFKIAVSIVIPFYNDGEYIEQTIYSVLNQTFPFFEILIIDDGSKDKQSLEKLDEIKKLDSRIKVFHKKNEGLAATRDFGANKSSQESKYFLFLDSDDCIDATYIECCYWTLETNKEASWAYSDTICFQSLNYTWNKKFNSKKLEKDNFLIATSMIRKKAFYEVKGFELKEKAINEDWNFWLKLIAKEKFPVHMNFYGQWYRRKINGELANANKNIKRTLEIIKQTKKDIRKKVNAIEYPNKHTINKFIDFHNFTEIPKKKKNNKVNLLFIFSCLIDDRNTNSNLEIIKKLNKIGYNIIIILTDININTLRQKFEEYATVYDLTTFLNKEFWCCFINYLIEKENINLIFNSECLCGNTIITYLKMRYPYVPILNYFSENYITNNNIVEESITNKNIQMIDSIIQRCIKSPNKEKIEYGINLSKTKQLIIEKILSDFKKDNRRTKKMCNLYNKKTYQEKITIRKILWNIPVWRKLMQSTFWKNLKNGRKRK